jgi:chromosome segregation ATPase
MNGVTVSGSLEVTDASQPKTMKTSFSQLQTQLQELSAAAQLKDVVSTHLQEAIAELNATKSALANTSLTKNATQQQIAALQAKHQESQTRLQKLIGDHSTLQQQLDAKSGQHNNTYNDLLAAQTGAAIAQGKWQEALSGLTNAQTQLAAVQASHDATKEQVAAIVALERAANVSAEAAKRERDVSRQKLDEAVIKNKQTQAQLEIARHHQQSLDVQLFALMADLNTLRQDLYVSTNAHNVTKASLKSAMISVDDLVKTLSATQLKLFYATQKNKNITKQLEAERIAKQAALKAKQDKEKEDERTRKILFGAIGGLSLLVVFLCSILCCLYRYRRRWLLNCLHVNRQESGGGDTVVVGRPCGGAGSSSAGAAATGGKQIDDEQTGEAPAKGCPFNATASLGIPDRTTSQTELIAGESPDPTMSPPNAGQGNAEPNFANITI